MQIQRINPIQQFFEADCDNISKKDFARRIGQWLDDNSHYELMAEWNHPWRQTTMYKLKQCLSKLYEVHLGTDIYDLEYQNSSLGQMFENLIGDHDQDGRLDFPIEDFVEYYDIIGITPNISGAFIPEATTTVIDASPANTQVEAQAISMERRVPDHAPFKNTTVLGITFEGDYYIQEAQTPDSSKIKVRPHHYPDRTGGRLAALGSVGSGGLVHQLNEIQTQMGEIVRSKPSSLGGAERLIYNAHLLASRGLYRTPTNETFGGATMVWAGYINDPGENDMRFYIEAAQKYGFDPGYLLILRVGESTVIDCNNGYGCLGLDRFAEEIPQLISEGYLPEEFNTCFEEALPTRNEKEEDVLSADFSHTSEAALAFVATMARHRDQVRNALRRAGKSCESTDVERFLTYVSFNGGLGTALEIIEAAPSTITASYLKAKNQARVQNNSSAFYNAAQRMDIYLFYRELGLFEGI